MNKNWSFLLFFVGMLFLITPVFAADVVLQNNTLVVTDVQDSLGLGGFHIILRHDDSLTVTSVEGIAPFIVSPNIQADNVNIAGIQASELLTGDVPVALVEYTGNGTFTIDVIELINSLSNPLGMEYDSGQTTSSGGDTVSGDRTEVATQTQTPDVTATQTPGVVATETPILISPTTEPQVSPVETISPEMKIDVNKTSETDNNDEALIPKQPTQASLPFIISIIGLLVVVVARRKVY